MDDWFSVIAAGSELPASSVRELDDVGFVVVPGPVAPPQLSRLRAVYDAAVSAADPADFNSGRTTTRVSDFINGLGCDPKRLRVLDPLPSTS